MFPSMSDEISNCRTISGSEKFDLNINYILCLYYISMYVLFFGCRVEMYRFFSTIFDDVYVAGDAGYVSDSDVCRRRGQLDSGYLSEGGAGRFKAEDGYRSEGGSEYYSRKLEQRLAYERERAEAEQQHRRFLEGKGKHQPLPQVLGAVDTNQVYKVVGARRNVSKADSGTLY